MNPNNKKTDFIFYFYIPLIIIAIVLFFFFPGSIVTAFRAHWFILLLLIILFFTPFANKSLGNSEKIPFWRWIVFVELTQLALNFIYAGFSNLFWHQLPISVNPDQSPIKTTSHYFLWQCGLFPWPLIILLSVIMSYYVYCRQEKTLFSIALKPLLRNKDTDSISSFVNFLSRLLILFSLASIVSFLGLSVCSWIFNALEITATIGLNVETIVLASILLWLINDPRFFNALDWLTTKHFPPALTAVIAIVSLSLVFLFLTLVLQSLSSLVPGSTINLLVLPTLHSNADWVIFTGLWWLSWTPLVVGLIVYLSRGYKIRTLYYGGTLIIISNALIQFLFSKTNLIDHANSVCSILLLLGTGFILGLFVRKTWLDYLMHGMTPSTREEKLQSLPNYLRSLLKTAGFIFIFYFPAGIIIVTFFTLIVVFPYAIILAMLSMASMALLKRLSL